MSKFWGAKTGHRSKKLLRKCPQCEKGWITRKSDKYRPYCSKACYKDSIAKG